MTTTAPFSRVTVVGTGLIGGSFALAVRSAIPGVHIAGWDKPDVLDRAVGRGVIDEPCLALRDAVSRAELIYIALPVGMTIERLPEIAAHAPAGALITDSASTKRAVCAAAEKSISNAVRFIGGHPMAGNEVSGLDAADGSLFRGAPYALIDNAEPDPPSLTATKLFRPGRPAASSISFKKHIR